MRCTCHHPAVRELSLSRSEDQAGQQQCGEELGLEDSPSVSLLAAPSSPAVRFGGKHLSELHSSDQSNDSSEGTCLVSSCENTKTLVHKAQSIFAK